MQTIHNSQQSNIRVWKPAPIKVKPSGVVHILKVRAKPSFHTFEFDSYNEAMAHAKKCAVLNPSKPYKQLKGSNAPVWCVTVRRSRTTDQAEYVRFDAVPGYLGWQVSA